MKFTAADWDLDAAVDLVYRASEIMWVNHMFGYDLRIVVDGQGYHFNVQRPTETATS
jgi:hypothetical protein